MKDYLQLPIIINSLDDLIHEHIKSFLSDCNVTDNQRFSLDKLRSLYVKDRSLFIQIVDELSLRGFSFFTEKPNNILPSGSTTFEWYILAPENEERYKKIDFQKLGMSGFIRRFNIDSDTFFHNIPLDGFKRINNSLDKVLLEKELLKAGLTIKNLSSGEIKETQQSYDKSETKTTTEDDVIETSDNIGEQEVLINDAFSENTFWQFRAFCNRKGLFKVSELTLEHIQEHESRKNVSPSKVLLIKKRLKELDKEKVFQELQEIFSKLPEDSIEKVFMDNIFKSFREFCKENEIKMVDDLTEEHIEKYAYTPGIGATKVEAVKKRLEYLSKQSEDVKELSSESNNSMHLVEDIFQEQRFWTFLNFCKKSGIESIHELTEKHFDKYGEMMYVGVGKVHAVKQIISHYRSIPHKEEKDRSEAQTEEITIEVAFSENIYRQFRKFCELNGIEDIFEITEDHFEQFKRMRGVGIGKVEAVQHRVRQLRTLYQNMPLPVKQAPKPLTFSLTARNMEIRPLFSEGKFNLFREYCEKKGLFCLGDIQSNHLEEFSREKMVGKKKVDEVRKVLSFYTESTEETQQFFDAGELFEQIQDLEVQYLLNIFGFHTQSQSKLRVKDIEGKDIASLKEEFEPHFLLSLTGSLIKQQTPTEIALGLKNTLTDRDYEVLVHRYGNEETLEEVGSRFGVTRERVRQISKKAVKKVSSFLSRHSFAKSIRILASNKSLISAKEFSQLLGDDNKFLMNIIKYENLQFSYYKKLDLFFLDEKAKVDFKPIDEFFSELPEVFYLLEYQQTLEELLDSIGIENPTTDFINQIIEAEQYIKYGDFYSRRKLPINEVITYLFKHYIHKPLRIDEDGVAYLQELAKRHLDYDLGSSVRSLDARIRDAENVLLVDRATFTYFDSESFDTSIISEIEAYLNEEFKTKDVINVEYVFDHFQSNLEALEVTNKLHLYSLIRYYLDEKYTIGQGNTLNIFKSEKSKVGLEERFISFMKKHGGLCTKEQLLEIVKPQYKVDLAISHSDKIIPWGNNHAILVENLKFQSAEKVQLIQYFKQAFKKGYTTANFLFKEMMFDGKLSVILRNKGIDDAAKLPAIIKLFIPKVKGHTNFLYLEGNEFNSFERVIEAQFLYETSRQEIREFALEHGYKEMMAAAFLKRLLEQEIYVEVDFDQLYPGKRLKISEDSLAEIRAYAEQEQGEQEYVSVSNLQGYRRKLPAIGFRWNAYLLATALRRCGYRQIKKIINDYRYDKIIVVKEDSPIQTFEDLIIYVLENEYKGNMHEYAIYDYLMEKGIVREQEYLHEKKLPHEIKTSDRFIFDELGNVSLRQGN